MSTNGRDHPTLSRFQNCTQMYHRFYMHNIVVYVLRCYSYKNQTSIFAILTRSNYFAGKLVRGDRCSNNTNFCVSYRCWSPWFDNRHIVWVHSGWFQLPYSYRHWVGRSVGYFWDGWRFVIIFSFNKDI